MQDRNYQAQAHTNIRAEYLKGNYHQLISMATGTGKTVVFSQLPEKFGDLLPGQSLILAHREELIDQAIAKMRLVNPKLRIDKEKANHRADPSLADCVVASVATLGRKGTKRTLKYNWSNFDKFVTDEAHHSVADTYMNVYESAGILAPGDKRLLLGVTATPQRGDGKAMASLYQKISFVYSMRQAIEEGWLVDVKGIRIKTDTSLDEVKTTKGDYQEGSLAEAINTPKRNQLIVKAWMEKGEHRQTIGFTANIQHALDLASMFRYHGVKAEAVWGDDPERAEKLAKHKAGQITVLLNCGVLVEGYDDWRIGCVILARPTKSPVLYVQMIGRGTRLQDDTGNLLLWTGEPIKQDCIILDVIDASVHNTLVTLPTLMGMSSSMDLRGGSLVKTVRAIEQAAKDHPAVDFSKLQDISNIQVMVEAANLFEVKYPAEVEEHSEFTWHNSPTGGFVLLLPDKDRLTICQNMLDKYELSGIIRGQKYKGERETLQEMFSAADQLIVDKCPESLKVVKREEKWHADPPTPKQLKRLAQIYKGKQLPLDLTKGQCSKLIGQYAAGKK